VTLVLFTFRGKKMTLRAFLFASYFQLFSSSFFRQLNSSSRTNSTNSIAFINMTSSKNVGIAFGLTFAAGAATALGASVVFFPRLVKFANRHTLAAALGFSAGVMT
jgi:lipoprotein signal peptidase